MSSPFAGINAFSFHPIFVQESDLHKKGTEFTDFLCKAPSGQHTSVANSTPSRADTIRSRSTTISPASVICHPSARLSFPAAPDKLERLLASVFARRR
jgi:hypothetical protein